jgi:hypothetical protein
VKKQTLGLIAAVSIAMPIAGLGVAVDLVLSPQPAQAACSNWLCGWENSMKTVSDEEGDKKVITRNFTLLRSFVALVIVGLGVGAFFSRDDKERMNWLLGSGGAVVVVALAINVIIGYIFGDGKKSEAFLTPKTAIALVNILPNLGDGNVENHQI